MELRNKQKASKNSGDKQHSSLFNSQIVSGKESYRMEMSKMSNSSKKVIQKDSNLNEVNNEEVDNLEKSEKSENEDPDNSGGDFSADKKNDDNQ